MKNSRIALLLHSLGGGGAERMTVNLAAGLVARGFTPDLVLVKAVGPFLPLVPSGVRVIDLKCLRHLTSLIPLARYLHREGPRVLLSALTHTNLYALAARAIARSSTRVVVRINNTIGEEVRDSAGFVDRVLRPAMVRRLYPAANGYVAVSDGAAASLRAAVGRLPSAIRVIRNPVVVPSLFQQAKAPLDDPWFCDTSVPVILSVGRLVPQKDFATLIRAFSILRQKRSARLVILGEGPERPALETLAQHSGFAADIQLRGFEPNPYPYIAAASTVALSSRFEGAPSVLVEALALGTPVVATDCRSGPREILHNGRLGRLTCVGDPHGLADGVEEILAGHARPRATAADLAEYHVDRAVDEYLQVCGLSPNSSLVAAS